MSPKGSNTIVSKQRVQVIDRVDQQQAFIVCTTCGFAHRKISEYKKHKAICSNDPLRDIFCPL